MSGGERIASSLDRIVRGVLGRSGLKWRSVCEALETVDDDIRAEVRERAEAPLAHRADELERARKA